jgi:hypothetical protein
MDKKVPVTKNFNQKEQPIGYIVFNDKISNIDWEKFTFDVAYIPLEVNSDGTITKTKLIEVSLIPRLK